MIKPESCVPCGKRIKFGKISLKCRDCRVVSHPECRERCPLPCIPNLGATPIKIGEVRAFSSSAIVISSSLLRRCRVISLIFHFLPGCLVRLCPWKFPHDSASCCSLHQWNWAKRTAWGKSSPPNITDSQGTVKPEVLVVSFNVFLFSSHREL